MGPDEIEERRTATSLIRQAGLAGMLSYERNAVIRHFFETSSYPYTKTADDDVESQVKNKSAAETDDTENKASDKEQGEQETPDTEESDDIEKGSEEEEEKAEPVETDNVEETR